MSGIFLDNGAVRFASMTAEEYMFALRETIAAARAAIERIKNKPASFANTVEPLEYARAEVESVGGLGAVLSALRADHPLVAAETWRSTAVAAFQTEWKHDPVLFERIRTVYDSRHAAGLNSEHKKRVERIYSECFLTGALCDKDARLEVRAIDSKLSRAMHKFRMNLNAAVGAYRKYVSDEDDLRGVPDDAKDMYRQRAADEGHPGQWLIELSPPPLAIFKFCAHRALRKEIYHAWHGLGGEAGSDNRPVLLDIVRLRHRKAQLLGFKNYAEMALSTRDEKDPKAVFNFMARRRKIFDPGFAKKFQNAKRHAQNDGIEDFQPWDFEYYWRKAQEAECEGKLEDFIDYFPLSAAQKGLFDHHRKLFEIAFEDVTESYETWHDDVRVYQARDKMGKCRGLVYVDWYARAGDKSGNWTEVLYRVPETGMPHVVVSFEFPPPARDRPCLLSHYNLMTLFHEFGHVEDVLLCQNPYALGAALNAPPDVLEVAAQVQECWPSDPDVLCSLARHWKTGATLTEKDARTVVALEKYNLEHQLLRYDYWSVLDMLWHSADPEDMTSVDVVETAARRIVHPSFGGILDQTSTTFDHIFGGSYYAAGFYGYDVARVLGERLFAEFQKNGLYDPEAAERLRKNIYETPNFKGMMP